MLVNIYKTLQLKHEFLILLSNNTCLYNNARELIHYTYKRRITYTLLGEKPLAQE
jgi:hypothetical protein